MSDVAYKRPEILVIDEDLLFSVRIETTLKKRGYDVHVTNDPEQAVEIADRHHLALTIINFGREGLAPEHTTRRLKTLPNAAPVLGFVSHTSIPQVRPNAMRAGCDLLVANSALTMRLLQLVEKLAPLDGSEAQIVEAEETVSTDEK